MTSPTQGPQHASSGQSAGAGGGSMFGPGEPPVPPYGAAQAGPGPMAPAGKAGRRWLHWVAYPAVLVVGMGIGAASAGAGDDDAGASAAGSSSSSAGTAAQPAAELPTEPAEPAAPVIDDYQVKVKTLSKHCFGSAGCNVDVRLELVLVGAQAEGQAAEISVTVSGAEDGDTVETINVDEDGKYQAPEVSLSTPRSGTKVKAKITEVVAD